MCVYYLLSQKVRARWERTLQYQKQVLPSWESLRKVFIVDAPLASDPSWRPLLPGDILPIRMFEGNYIRFAFAKNAGLQWGVENKFDWVLDCDADTVILTPPTVYPETGYGTMLCYLGREEETIEEIETTRKSGVLKFEASSRFLIRRDLCEKYRYNEEFVGYCGEDVDFHKNILLRSGIQNSYTDARGIHIWHERPTAAESLGFDLLNRRSAETDLILHNERQAR